MSRRAASRRSRCDGAASGRHSMSPAGGHVFAGLPGHCCFLLFSGADRFPAGFMGYDASGS